MKIILLLVAVLALTMTSQGQPSSQKQCVVIKNAPVKAYIPGHRDSLISHHLIEHGFVLMLKDQSYTIISFQVIFERENFIVFIPSDGPFFKTIESQDAPLKNMNLPGNITINLITAMKNGRCYRLPDIKYRVHLAD